MTREQIDTIENPEKRAAAAQQSNAAMAPITEAANNPNIPEEYSAFNKGGNAYFTDVGGGMMTAYDPDSGITAKIEPGVNSSGKASGGNFTVDGQTAAAHFTREAPTSVGSAGGSAGNPAKETPASVGSAGTFMKGAPVSEGSKTTKTEVTKKQYEAVENRKKEGSSKIKSLDNRRK